ncbi:MAG: translocation/assembly module TamB domain-containing protein [Proteobacteria bacterium]|nr:translocation/assembly module TamB domain-containing protein [Pseudomonadota bacterium]
MRLDDGKITIGTLDVRSAVATVSGSGTYVTATGAGEGKARLDVPDLSAFSAVAGRRLAGAAALDVTASGDRQGARASWQATINGVQVEGVSAEALREAIVVSGSASLQAGGAWRLADARIASAAGQATLSGQGAGNDGTLDLSVDLPTLSILDSSVAGAGRVTGRVTRASGRAEAKLDGTLTGLARGPVVSRTLTLSAAAGMDPSGAASGTLTLGGDLAEQPVSLDGRFSVDAAGGVRVPSFQGKWASAVLDVRDFAIAGERATGQARLKVGRLEDASALSGTPLAGALDVEIAADPAAAGEALTVRADGTGLRAGTLAVSGLEVRATVERPGPDLALDATLAANGLAGVADLSSVKVAAKGSLQDMAVAVQAGGRETRATVDATLRKAGEELTVALRRLDASYRSIPVVLTAPTTVVVAGPRVKLEPVALRVGTGRVSARGTVAPEGNDLQVEIAALPLQLVDAFAPGTGLDGALQAKAQVRGTSAAPSVDATYSIAALRLRQPDMALLPPVAIQGTASLAGQEAGVQARATAAGGTALTLKGRATLPRAGAPLAASAAVSGTVELAPLAPLLGNTVRNVSGRLRPDLTVEIAGAQVSGSGAIDFSNGALALPDSGMRLSNGQGRLVLQGNTLQVQRLAFQTAGNGTVGLGGSVSIDPQGSVRPDLSITSRSALLVNRPDLIARVSADLKVTGDTASALDVSGPIRIDRAEVSIGGQQAAAFPTLDVREVNKPGVSPAQLVAMQPPPKDLGAAPSSGPPVRLNITIDAPQAVFVRGRGLDAEMGGQLAVGGTPAAPAVTGGLTIRRGEFNLLGHRLTFSKGVVTLDNLDRVDPRLDFVANTTINQVVITVTIAGTARAPSIAVSSSPAMPPDEAMAMLLFGKPASGLSVFELAQAAQGLAELTGQASGAGALGRLRGGLGLDRLSVDSGKSATAPVSVEAGRYVAPGVYVGARQGATGNSSRGVVQVEVLDHVKIEGDIGADSTGRVGIKTEWDY